MGDITTPDDCCPDCGHVECCKLDLADYDDAEGCHAWSDAAWLCTSRQLASAQIALAAKDLEIARLRAQDGAAMEQEVARRAAGALTYLARGLTLDWIPVGVRLPVQSGDEEYEREVLVCFGDDGQEIAHVRYCAWAKESERWQVCNTGRSQYCVYKVTHWRDLPVLPKSST